MQDAMALDTHAKAISELASQAAMQYFRGTLGIEFKQDQSPVTQADKDVEAKVRSYLNRYFPDHGVFGEEEGQDTGDGRHMWVIDPIDGTRSFLSGHPLFGFLLAYLVDGHPQLGVVGMPALNETFFGVLGKGASLNGQPIHVSDKSHLDQAILYVNEGDKLYSDHPDLFNRLMQSGQTRRFAYDGYPHALLAAGHVDAVVDYDLQPYDFLALSPLIEAAGGVMTDWQGRPLELSSNGAVVSAATPALHAELLELLNP
ncbi:inositol monophosphatase family protein [Ruegeria meonggei]|uniref:Inositol-1-monophosphatase n=1 Tax=Ruegeria meonggei TaxID=1446476 RepID=A0A1X7ACD7_9RHOB|nr:inositol monophosphatase family protein [Ruegeria meonggei]SLN75516.1 Inositol-1-monophosphatase [Ruegeria meonggei]